MELWDQIHGTVRQKDRIYREDIFWGKGKEVANATRYRVEYLVSGDLRVFVPEMSWKLILEKERMKTLLRMIAIRINICEQDT